MWPEPCLTPQVNVVTRSTTCVVTVVVSISRYDVIKWITVVTGVMRKAAPVSSQRNWWKSVINAWLTDWGRVAHICVGNLTITGSDNGLSHGRRQAIIWANAGILFIEPLGTVFSEIVIWIHIFSFQEYAFENVLCEMAAILSRPQFVNMWLGLVSTLRPQYSGQHFATNIFKCNLLIENYCT